jgi:hypothetical protein
MLDTTPPSRREGGAMHYILNLNLNLRLNLNLS